MINKVNTRHQSKRLSPTNKEALQLSLPESKRSWQDIKCPSCGQFGHHIDIHGCDATAIKTNIETYCKEQKHKFDKDSVLSKFEKFQKEKRLKRLNSLKARNKLRRQLRVAKMELENDENQFHEVKSFYIRAFKQEHEGVDLNDPRQDHNHEIKEYDILESEPESENDMQ